MRCWLPLAAVLSFACSDVTLDDDAEGPAPLVVDLEGDFGPPAPPPRGARAVHLRFDVGPAALAFNETGIVVAANVPPGGATPYLPLPVPVANLQLWADGAVVATTPTATVPEGEGALLAVYGTQADPRSLATTTDLRGTLGQVRARVLHATPGLPYVGLIDLNGSSPLPALTYGVLSASFVFEADTEQRWALDLTGDGRPNLPLAAFEVPALDSADRPQVLDFFIVPTGETLPGPAPLPIPALLAVPLDAPDGIFVVPPTAG